MPRSSSAVAISCPSLRTERTSTAVSAGSIPSATSRSISAATAWACARSFSQRQNDTGSRPSAVLLRDERNFFGSRSWFGSTTAWAASRIAWWER
jgi:hypothetical protein